MARALGPESRIIESAPPVGVASAQMVSLLILFHEYKVHGTNDTQKGGEMIPV